MTETLYIQLTIEPCRELRETIDFKDVYGTFATEQNNCTAYVPIDKKSEILSQCCEKLITRMKPIKKTAKAKKYIEELTGLLRGMHKNMDILIQLPQLNIDFVIFGNISLNLKFREVCLQERQDGIIQIRYPETPNPLCILTKNYQNEVDWVRIEKDLQKKTYKTKNRKGPRYDKSTAANTLEHPHADPDNAIRRHDNFGNSNIAEIIPAGHRHSGHR